MCVLITKRQYKDLCSNWKESISMLWDGYSMEITRIKTVKNCIGFIKYYKIYIKNELSQHSQKDIVLAFKRIGIIS
jgi:hypothetical protein